jgi:hypothetical protein
MIQTQQADLWVAIFELRHAHRCERRTVMAVKYGQSCFSHARVRVKGSGKDP